MKPSRLRQLLNWYGPYLGAGVRVEQVGDNWRYLRVSMALRWYNRNAVNCHFGGSLYAMVDPHYMLLLMKCLGREYTVWDKSASIEFIRPGKGRVWAEFHITDEMLEDIYQHTSDGQKYLPTFPVEVKDDNNKLVCRVEKTLYIRKQPQARVRV